MDPKEIRGLVEAYSEVYAPQEELDEARPIYSRGGEQRRTQTPRQIGVKSAPHNIPRGGTTISDRDPQGKRLFTGDQDRGKGNKAARRAAALKNEELDIFDIVFEFLQVEGYAETLEEAEWIMANELDAEDIDAILEAEGSYGQTPKASAAYSALVRKRTNKPASEYSKKGEKTKKVKSAEKHMWRSLRGGPHHGRGKMTADDRTERRSERAFDLETSYGSGSVTKNPKKLRKQKAMGEHD